VKPSNVAASQV